MCAPVTTVLLEVKGNTVSVYEGAADLCVWLHWRLFTGAHCPRLGPPAG